MDDGWESQLLPHTLLEVVRDLAYRPRPLLCLLPERAQRSGPLNGCCLALLFEIRFVLSRLTWVDSHRCSPCGRWPVRGPNSDEIFPCPGARCSRQVQWWHLLVHLLCEGVMSAPISRLPSSILCTAASLAIMVITAWTCPPQRRRLACAV